MHYPCFAMCQASSCLTVADRADFAAAIFCLQEHVATSTDAWSSSHNAGAHVLNVNAIANGTSVFLDMLFTGSDSHTGNYIATEVGIYCKKQLQRLPTAW